MPMNGYFQNVFRTGYALRVEWSIASQSIEDNTSIVNVSAYLVSAGSAYHINSSASKTVNLYINGTKYTKTAGGLANLSSGQKKLLFSKSLTIAHNIDGSKSIPIYCTFGLEVTLSGTYWSDVRAPASGVYTAVLQTIPRATTPATSGTWNIGNTVAINVQGASEDFHHTIQYSLNNIAWIDIANGVKASAAWTIPESLAHAKTNATTGTVYIRCITYRGDVNIGSKTISRSYIITSSLASPTVTITDQQTNAANIARYIRSRSTVTLTAVSAFRYSATARKYVFNYGNDSTTVITTEDSASATFILPPNASTAFSYGVTVTDSRGYTASASGSFLTVDYVAPQISNFYAIRGNYIDDIFAENPKGNSLKIEFQYAITSLNTENDKKYKIEYRLASDTAYTELVAENTASDYNGTITEYTDAIFSENAAYVIRLSLIDSFDSVLQIIDIPSQKVLMNFSANGKAMAIGGIASIDDALQIMMQIYATGGIKSMQIANGTNFNEIVKTGSYVGNVESGNYVSIPESTGTFILDVLNAGLEGQLMQRFSYCDKLRYHAYVRFLYDGSWGEWQPTEGFTEYHTANYSGRIRLANGFMMQWGRVLITPDSAHVTKAVDIVYPVEFSQLPIIHTSLQTDVPNVAHASASEVSISGTTLYLHKQNTTAAWVSWFAVGMG